MGRCRDGAAAVLLHARRQQGPPHPRLARRLAARVGEKNRERGRRKGQGQKGYFTELLSPQKPKINILLEELSTSKFAQNQSVF